MRDAATVFVVADHGGMRQLKSSVRAGAYPTVMMKLPHATGPLRHDGSPVLNSDIAATVCAVTQRCTAEGGVPLNAAEAERTGRERLFHDYRWRAEYWELDSIPGIRSFRIDGKVTDPRAWTEYTGGN